MPQNAPRTSPRAAARSRHIPSMQADIGCGTRNLMGGLIGLGISPCSTCARTSLRDPGSARPTRAPRIGVHRVRVEGAAWRDLHDLSEIHHDHPVADVLDDREVVRDEQDGQVELSFRSSSRLITCAWIDTSSAETGSSARMNSRIDRKRPRDADPLPLSAGEFVRIAAM